MGGYAINVQDADGYFLRIYSGRFSIQADNDEQAKIEAKKMLDSMGAIHDDVVLYHTRVLTKFPAKPIQRELRDLKDLPLYDNH